MTVSDKLKLAVAIIFLSLSGVATAQNSADDEADVILLIEEQWEAQQDGDDNWSDDMLVDSFSSWPTQAPAPRSKSSTQLWNRFADF